MKLQGLPQTLTDKGGLRSRVTDQMIRDVILFFLQVNVMAVLIMISKPNLKTLNKHLVESCGFCLKFISKVKFIRFISH